MRPSILPNGELIIWYFILSYSLPGKAAEKECNHEPIANDAMLNKPDPLL
jgi:hypothetical protein